MQFSIEKDDYDIPVYEKVMELYDSISGLMKKGIIVSAYALDSNGLAAALSKMAFGNGLGVAVDKEVPLRLKTDWVTS